MKQDNQIKIIKISDGEQSFELTERILGVVNEYSGILSAYELIGVLDLVKRSVYKCLEIEGET